MLKALSQLFKVDEPKKEPEDIELIEDKYYLDGCYYINNDITKKFSNVVHFHHDGLGFGEYSIKYEYIIIFKKLEKTNSLLLTTFTTLSEFKMNVADKISYLVLEFNSYQDMVSFELRMLGKILYYKELDTFDKSIFKLKNFITWRENCKPVRTCT
jgi:hypothetical protein